MRAKAHVRIGAALFFYFQLRVSAFEYFLMLNAAINRYIFFLKHVTSF